LPAEQRYATIHYRAALVLHSATTAGAAAAAQRADAAACIAFLCAPGRPVSAAAAAEILGIGTSRRLVTVGLDAGA